HNNVPEVFVTIDFPLGFNLPNKEAPEECDVNQQSVIVNFFKQQYYTLAGKWLGDSIQVFESEDVEFVTLNLKLRLSGGKGGFGSMLRVQGGIAEQPPTKNIRFDDTEYLKASEEIKKTTKLLYLKSNSTISSNSAAGNSRLSHYGKYFENLSFSLFLKFTVVFRDVDSGSDSSEDGESDTQNEFGLCYALRCACRLRISLKDQHFVGMSCLPSGDIIAHCWGELFWSSEDIESQDLSYFGTSSWQNNYEMFLPK
ncbi:10338_t:CDS:2, partial [Scutellospora calospora]